MKAFCCPPINSSVEFKFKTVLRNLPTDDMQMSRGEFDRGRVLNASNK